MYFLNDSVEVLVNGRGPSTGAAAPDDRRRELRLGNRLLPIRLGVSPGVEVPELRLGHQQHLSGHRGGVRYLLESLRRVGPAQRQIEVDQRRPVQVQLRHHVAGLWRASREQRQQRALEAVLESCPERISGLRHGTTRFSMVGSQC